MQNNSCTICSNDSYTLIFSMQEKVDLVKCKKCGHFYSKFDDIENYSNLYDDGSYKIIDARGSIFEKIWTLENHLRLKALLKLKKGLKKILDFGCGKGHFLHLLKSKGYEVLGIETSIPRATFGMKNYNLDIITNEYTSGRIKNSPFDVITLFHVLEHILQPAELLHNIVSSNLVKDGILLIEVPNISSLQAKISKNHWMHLDIPRHINHFTERTLNKLIEENDLEVIKTEYFSISAGVLGMTNAIYNLFSPGKSLLNELKFNFNIKLILFLMFFGPISFIIELLASIFKYGSVIRIYARKTNS